MLQGTHEAHWQAEWPRHAATSVPTSRDKALGSCHPHLPGPARPPLYSPGTCTESDVTSGFGSGQADPTGSPVIGRPCPRAPAAPAPRQRLSGHKPGSFIRAGYSHAAKISFNGFSFVGTRQGLAMVRALAGISPGQPAFPGGAAGAGSGVESECKPGALGARRERLQRGAGTGRTRDTASYPAVSTQTEERHPGGGRKVPDETSPRP